MRAERLTETLKCIINLFIHLPTFTEHATNIMCW